MTEAIKKIGIVGVLLLLIAEAIVWIVGPEPPFDIVLRVFIILFTGGLAMLIVYYVLALRMKRKNLET